MGVSAAVGRGRPAPRARRERGQMTVEFAVTFPLLIVIAVIAVNALLFFADCAAFDNEFRDAVRIYAASPAYEQDLEESKAQVQTALSDSFDEDNLSVSVAVEGTSSGFVTFSGTLKFSPTLFGMGLVDEVFGVELPKLSHTVQHTIDVYKPGVLL